MRLAYEVRPISLDGISLSQPVPIGSILRLTSHILHTTLFMSCSHAADVQTGSEHTQMTFDSCGTWRMGREQAILWLEGKRALELGAEIREVACSTLLHRFPFRQVPFGCNI
ncbi:hypothetical protein JOM56_007883, partial [Amanita muscaria]